MSNLPVVLVFIVVIAGLLVWKIREAENAPGDRRQGKLTRTQAAGHLGKRAVQASAQYTRPSLATPRKAPITEVGVYVGDQAGVRIPQELHAPLEDSQILVGPPGSGKTLKIRRTIAEFPGAVVATSTKLDILRHTVERRRRRFGRSSTHLFNPRRLGDQKKYGSTVKFSVVGGCDDPSVARSRANYLLSGTAAAGGSDKQADFWDGHASKVLRAFLFTAAHHGLSILTVKQWVNRKDDTPMRLLERIDHPVARSMLDELSQTMKEYDKFKGSVFATLAQAFDAFSDEGVMDIVQLGEGDREFDPVRFLRRRETIYLVGEQEENASISPLFCALAGSIYEAAKTIGQRTDERLDPPVLFCLDEAPNIATLPLHRMTSVGRGLGITFLLGIQQERQLADVWGDKKGGIIWTNCRVKLIFGGTHDDQFLERISKLAGEHEHISTSTTVAGTDGKQSKTTTYEMRRNWPVGEIRQLPDGHALALVSNKPAVEVQFTPFHENKRYLRRERKWFKELDPVPPTPRPRPPGRPMTVEPVGEIATITTLHPQHAEDEAGESSG